MKREHVTLAAVESERALLGGLILQASELPQIRGMVKPADFYRPEHGALFGLLCDMEDDGGGIDLVSVSERVLRGGRAERYGGSGYVAELPEHAPATTNLPHYAEVIAEWSARRTLWSMGHDIVARAEGSEELDTVLADSVSRITSVALPGRGRAVWLGEATKRTIDEAERVEKGEVVRIPTCFRDLDALLAGGGLRPGHLIILGGRPSMGKSALGQNIVERLAKREFTTGVFSMEMDQEEWSSRALAAQSRIKLDVISAPKLWSYPNPQDPARRPYWDAIVDAEAEIAKWPILLDTRPGLTIEQISAEARRWKHQHNVRLILVDYLGMMPSPLGLKQEGTGRNALGLKDLAKELRIPIILLCQLNRKSAERTEKEPVTTDLRDSGEIEQHADVIIFVHRPHYYDHTADRRQAKILVPKQRGGQTGELELEWYGEVQLFTDAPTPEEARARALKKQDAEAARKKAGQKPEKEPEKAPPPAAVQEPLGLNPKGSS